MAENSKIGWTDHTWNPWWGCNKVSEECARCYIEGIMKRAGKTPFDGPIRTSETTWKSPIRWNKQNQNLKIFTCSMSDFFHEEADEWRPEAWDIIKQSTNLDFLILTKRPERILESLPSDWDDGYRNVWLGVTVGTNNILGLNKLL